jgi:hypothetical protein
MIGEQILHLLPMDYDISPLSIVKFLKSRVEKYHNPLVLAERKGGLWVMVLKATFNNISIISCRNPHAEI